MSIKIKFLTKYNFCYIMFIDIVNRYYVGAQMYSIFVDNHKNLSDKDIIERIKAGDNEFLDSLFSRYINLVRIKVAQFSVCDTEVEDFVQEGLIALYHSARTYDFSGSSFATYASTCVSNAILTLLKHKSRKKRIPENLVSSIEDKTVTIEETPEALMIERENIKGIYNRIKEILSDFEYKVFVLSLNAYSVEDISQKLNVNEKAVSNALCRLRKKIKTQLTDNR